jgi:predicted N-formylglutamate amidohydrolase
MRPPAWRPDLVIVTCEHAGADVPPELASLFRRERALLKTHRGFDIGASGVARRLATDLAAPLWASRVTRLVVDLNRSLRSPTLFSRITRDLEPEAQRALLARYYTPYRSAIEGFAGRAIEWGQAVLHLAVHTFTPVLDGRVRACEVGLLFDPARAHERALAVAWRRSLEERRSAWRVRLNYPYRGTSDGLTTHLRTVLPPRRYAGIEIEINQRLVARPAGAASIAELLAATVPLSR